ncbi:MAG: DUF2281 domain-containing protein [Gallionella sp.]|nr:DUF2281 domain-containing protein [Gallionella sp.]
MTTTEKLYKTVQDMPEPILAELLDFAEFLRTKMLDKKSHSSNELLIDLKGGLENSTTFAGDPLVIQKRLRDEWS